MSFFGGVHRHKLDQKNRFRIPSELRDQFDKNAKLCIYKGIGNCYVISSEQDFKILIEKYTDNISSISSDISKQKALRILMSRFKYLEEDAQGRITLPKFLREDKKIQFNKDIVFLGMGDRIELWPEELYDEEFDISNEDYENLLKAIN